MKSGQLCGKYVDGKSQARTANKGYNYIVIQATIGKVISMAKYIVTYEETLSKSFVVEADNPHDAHWKIIDAVEIGDIELTADNYVCGEITCVRESRGQDEWIYETI